MSLTKQISLDKVEIVGEWKRLQVRYKTSITENGKLLSESYMREAYDVDYGIENLNAELQPYVTGVWTDEVLQSWNGYLEATTPSYTEEPAEEPAE